MEYSVNSNFKLYSDLILVIFIFIRYRSPSVTVEKRIFPESLGTPQKNQCYCFFRGTQCMTISECIISWFWFFYFDFPLFTRGVRIKVIYSSTFYKFRKRSSDITHFVEHPVYSILKMYSLLIRVFLFWITTIHSKWFTQRQCVKVTFFEIPSALRKKQCDFIFPRAPYI